MNSDVARTLIPGQKIKYWDGRIATVVSAWTPPVAVRNVPEGLEIVTPRIEGGEIAISFDEDVQVPKSVNYLKDYDFRLAEPV